MNEPLSLSNCDQEPIHVPGSIQPHGALLVFGENQHVTQASGSVRSFLGTEPQALIGVSVRSIFGTGDASGLSEQLASIQDHRPQYLRPLTVGGQVFDAIAHRYDGVLALELEPSDGAMVEHDLYTNVQAAIAEFQAARTIEQLAGSIATHVRELNRFDRVMVYRFDNEWNGQVIAESKRDDLETYLGLNYPASDIPAQARELYRKNRLRFIADRDYVPSPVVPALNPTTGRPLDMSFAVLRSVSPIHLEYLRNMGVGASMSISLLRDGELWGLIACHHYSPKRVPFRIRTASELLGQVMSMQVAVLSTKIAADDARGRQEQIETILGCFDSVRGLGGLLDSCGDEIAGLLGCTGLAIVNGEDVIRTGQVPSPDDVLRILREVRRRDDPAIFSTDSLRSVLHKGTLDPIASGVIVISLADKAQRCLIGFRPEHVRTVNWAGDPAKSVTKGDGQEVRLSPRGSFALWKQTLESRSLPWSESDLTAARTLRRRLIEKFAAFADELERHNVVLRQHGDEQQRLFEREHAARIELERLSRLKDDFVATLSHELRTPLNAIQGWTQLLRGRRDLDDDAREALDVIDRNTRAQTQMVEDLLDMSRITAGKLRLDVQDVDLPVVVQAAIATVQIAADAKSIRITPLIDTLKDVRLNGDPQRLQQVFWNLLSNAVKFAHKGGHVNVVVKRINSHVEVSIRDNGIGISAEFLPHVFDRFRQGDQAITRQQRGLGLGLAIVRNLVELHGGSISAYSAGTGQGSTFTVTLPVSALASGPESHDQSGESDCEASGSDVSLKGLSLLVVEDELDSRELLRRVFEGCGAEVTTASNVPEALHQLYGRTFDALISDVGLPAQDGYYLIEQVREMEQRNGRSKMPAVALTAYARAEDRRRLMLAGFQVHVAKPAEPGELCAVVASVTGRI